jgi:hypothetical protein
MFSGEKISLQTPYKEVGLLRAQLSNKAQLLLLTATLAEDSKAKVLRYCLLKEGQLDLLAAVPDR